MNNEIKMNRLIIPVYINEKIVLDNLPTLITKIAGPALIVIPVAIYA